MMASDERTAERQTTDTTRVAEPVASEPEPGYWQPLKGRGQQPATTTVVEGDPQCNCGGMPGRPARECPQCGLSENLERAEHRVRELERRLAECQSYWTDRTNKNRERADEAERQLATERERNKHLASEFEKIAKGEHPRYWTLEKGDVLFRPTGECRPPKEGEYFWRSACVLKANPNAVRGNYPIYRRIEAPSEASASPPPVSAQEGEHATIREQAAEIERLKAAAMRTVEIADKCGTTICYDSGLRDVLGIKHGVKVAPAAASEGSKAEMVTATEGKLTIGFPASPAPAAESGKRASNILATTSGGMQVCINLRAVTHLVELYNNETRVCFGNAIIDIGEPIAALAAQLESTQKEGAK